MSDGNEELQQHIEASRIQPIEAYRIVEDDARSRHSDASMKIAQADEEIHIIEKRMHEDARLLRQWQDHKVYQTKRQQAHERRLIDARSSRRMAEDEESGVMQ